VRAWRQQAAAAAAADGWQGSGGRHGSQRGGDDTAGSRASTEPKIGRLPELVFAALLNYWRGTLKLRLKFFTHCAGCADLAPPPPFGVGFSSALCVCEKLRASYHSSTNITNPAFAVKNFLEDFIYHPAPALPPPLTILTLPNVSALDSQDSQVANQIKYSSVAEGV
jgi:hypothetical protein